MLAVSNFLQGTLYRLLGPALIVIGMVLLGLIPLPIPQRMKAPSEASVRKGGLWSAAGLGALFGLSYCPVSAALFFGMLIPLAVTHGSVLAIPGVYGVATGIPVAVFAGAIAFGTKRVARCSRWQGVSSDGSGPRRRWC